MQTITLRCDDCGKARMFEGRNLDAILKAITAAKWRDRPDGALCPECDAEEDRQYAEENAW